MQFCPLCNGCLGVDETGNSFRIADKTNYPEWAQALAGFLVVVIGTLVAVQVVVFAFPAAPKSAPRPASPLQAKQTIRDTEQLAKVPEIGLERVDTKVALNEAYVVCMELHRGGSDAYLDAIVSQRSELQGLPFLRGNACRLNDAQAYDLGHIAPKMRQLPALRSSSRNAATEPDNLINDVFYDQMRPTIAASLPAAMQVLSVQTPEFRIGISRTLRTFPAGDDAAINALVRLALFDPDLAVRRNALHGLQREPVEKFGLRLLEGFNYPWPVVAERTAEAIVRLDRYDLLPAVAEFLDGPDPAAPFERVEGARKSMAIRELVRVNHHRNCLLCHAPATGQEARELRGLVAVVPSADEQLPPMNSNVYYASRSGLPIVRANETYLRQDFSVMQTVEHPDFWPAQQRFDFFVRTRTLSPDEAAALKKAPPAAGQPASPNHAAAIDALRRLTWQSAGVTTRDWRPVVAKYLAH
jgi:hypothetical protein